MRRRSDRPQKDQSPSNAESNRANDEAGQTDSPLLVGAAVPDQEKGMAESVPSAGEAGGQARLEN